MEGMEEEEEVVVVAVVVGDKLLATMPSTYVLQARSDEMTVRVDILFGTPGEQRREEGVINPVLLKMFFFHWGIDTRPKIKFKKLSQEMSYMYRGCVVHTHRATACK